MIRDDVFARLLPFLDVVTTGHQGLFTIEALPVIAEPTFAGITAFETTGHAVHELT